MMGKEVGIVEELQPIHEAELQALLEKYYYKKRLRGKLCGGGITTKGFVFRVAKVETHKNHKGDE
jgi:hypothetical protein